MIDYYCHKCGQHYIPPQKKQDAQQHPLPPPPPPIQTPSHSGQITSHHYSDTSYYQQPPPPKPIVRYRLTPGRMLIAVFLILILIGAIIAIPYILEEASKNVYVIIKNDTSDEVRCELSIDGDQLGVIYVKSGQTESRRTEYEKGTVHSFVLVYYVFLGIPLTTNVDSDRSVEFEIHSDNRVTYSEY